MMRLIKQFSTFYLIDGIADGEYGPDAFTEEDQIDCTPDWEDLLDGDCSIHIAARAIIDAGCGEDNGDGSFYDPDGSFVTNYYTGEECSRSMHLYGFSDSEQALVGDLVAIG